MKLDEIDWEEAANVCERVQGITTQTFLQVLLLMASLYFVTGIMSNIIEMRRMRGYK